MSVHLGGSRSLSSSPIVGQVVRAVLASGQAVHVGCAVGADQQVVQAALAAGGQSFLVVFAVFSSSWLGAWSGSAVGAVMAAAQAGASVSWLAGGGLQLPLVARLIRRSQAALAGCSASVFFLASPSSSGSLAVAGHAVAAGQPVFAFCSFLPQAPRGQAGRWVSSSFMGFSCWLWQPVAVQQSLFEPSISASQKKGVHHVSV
jgi:predicted Rossmann fold nucleotide-binding protein DprA/Smf involved in DNA uptake